MNKLTIIDAEELARKEPTAAQPPTTPHPSTPGPDASLDSTNGISLPGAASLGQRGSGGTAAPAVATAKPLVKLTPDGPRPTDDAIIEVLALHYRVHESKIIAWLLAMDLEAASVRMAEEFSH